MKRSLAASALALLLTPLASAGSEAPSLKPKSSVRPEMSFHLSAYHGKSPLEVTLTAKIRQSAPGIMKRCWIRADWENTTGVGLPFRSRRQIPCGEEKAEIGVPESFQKSLVLEKAGTYSYRIILEDHEGGRYASASREVRVFDGEVEIRAGTTGTEN